MKQRAATNPPPRPAAKGAAGGPGVADRLAALAEPIHLRILRLLEQEELSVGEVAKVLQLPQSTVSRRLKVLGDAGWLFKRAEGTATYYRLMLDDLPAEVRTLWLTVRAQMLAPGGGGEGLAPAQLQTDAHRLESVLAERASDSLGFFGRVAGEWDAIRSELFGADFTARALLALIPARWTVADLGCGTGNASEHLAPYVAKVIAIDQSAPMLKAARKRLHAFRNVDFVRAELTDLPLPDASVDAAMCVLVLHHLDDPASALAEMRRILRPGGAALVVDMREHERRLYRETMGHRHLGFSEETILDALREAGLAEGRIVELACDPAGKGPDLFVATARRPSDGDTSPNRN